jgi:hypothetical protein
LQHGERLLASQGRLLELTEQQHELLLSMEEAYRLRLEALARQSFSFDHANTDLRQRLGETEALPAAAPDSGEMRLPF